MDETAVTEAVVRYLARNGWRMHSVHFPGAQGGIRLRLPSAAGTRSKDVIVPDIIASKRGVFLIVESKPRFSKRDALKVRAAASPACIPSLVRAFRLRSPPRLLLPGIAFAGEPPSEPSVPAGLLVFVISCDGSAVDLSGTLGDPSVARPVLPDYKHYALHGCLTSK